MSKRTTIILFDFFCVFFLSLHLCVRLWAHTARRRNTDPLVHTDCQRLHARPPDFPEFSLSTWVVRHGTDSGSSDDDDDRNRRRPFHFCSALTRVCVCVCVLLPQLEKGSSSRRKISLFTVFLRVPHLHDDWRWRRRRPTPCGMGRVGWLATRRLPDVCLSLLHSTVI